MEDEILTKDKSDDGTALEKQSYENLLNRAVSDVFNQYDSDGKKILAYFGRYYFLVLNDLLTLISVF